MGGAYIVVAFADECKCMANVWLRCDITLFSDVCKNCICSTKQLRRFDGVDVNV